MKRIKKLGPGPIILLLAFFLLGMQPAPKPKPPAVTSWWLCLDLGKSSNLTKINIVWHAAYGSTNYSIQGSNNNSSWANLQVNQSSAGATSKEHTLTGSYRYLRIYINKAVKNYPIIYEVKVYGIPPNFPPPQITSLLPVNHASFISGDTVNIAVNASSQDQNNLQYRYRLGSAIIKDWSGTASYNFVTTSQQPGRHSLTVDVKDSIGGTAAKTIEIYIFRKFPKPAG